MYCFQQKFCINNYCLVFTTHLTIKLTFWIITSLVSFTKEFKIEFSHLVLFLNAGPGINLRANSDTHETLNNN